MNSPSAMSVSRRETIWTLLSRDSPPLASHARDGRSPDRSCSPSPGAECHLYLVHLDRRDHPTLGTLRPRSVLSRRYYLCTQTIPQGVLIVFSGRLFPVAGPQFAARRPREKGTRSGRVSRQHGRRTTLLRPFGRHFMSTLETSSITAEPLFIPRPCASSAHRFRLACQ